MKKILIVFLFFFFVSLNSAQNASTTSLFAGLMDAQNKKASSIDTKYSRLDNDYSTKLENAKATEAYEDLIAKQPLSSIEAYFNQRKLRIPNNIFEVKHDNLQSQPPENSTSNLPPGVDISDSPPGVDISDLPPGVDISDLPAGVDISKLSSKHQDLNKDQNSNKHTHKLRSKIDDKKLLPPIRQFGYHFFHLPSKINSQPVPDTYQLGPGDQLHLKIWGKINNALDLIIDSSGSIYLPKAGRVKVSGLSLKKVNQLVKSLLKNHFVNIDSLVTLSGRRVITIYRTGHFKNTGPLNLEFGSSLIEALSLSEGPLKTGSLRKIHIKRKGKTIKTIDLYDYFIGKDSFYSLILEHNDTIHIPNISHVAMIEGVVKRPGIYEFKDTVSLKTFLSSYSGGTLQPSIHDLIQIERLSDTERSSSILLISAETKQDFNKKLSSTFIQNGDIIRVFSDTSFQSNAIQIDGSVSFPGQYPFNDGMTFDSLLTPHFFLPDAFQGFVYVYRFKEGKRELIHLDQDDFSTFKLKKWDLIYVLNHNELQPEHQFYIYGAVKKTGHFPIFQNMKLSDAILLSQPNAHAYLDQIDVLRQFPNQSHYAISGTDIINNYDSEKNIHISPGDQIFIKSDPRLTQRIKVDLLGQVQFNGTYTVHSNTRLYDLLVRAGGFLPEAFPEGVVIKRKSQQKAEQKSQLKALIEEKKLLLLNYSSEIDPEKTLKSLTFLRQEAVEAEGRISINLPSNLEDLKSSVYNILLQDGDSIMIPQKPNTVQVLGGVHLPTSFIYQKNKSLSYYIHQAGGFNRFSDTKQVYIFRANGTVVMHKSRFSSPTIYEGDAIYVPEKIRIHHDWLKMLTETSQVIFNLVTSAKITGLIKD